MWMGPAQAIEHWQEGRCVVAASTKSQQQWQSEDMAGWAVATRQACGEGEDVGGRRPTRTTTMMIRHRVIGSTAYFLSGGAAEHSSHPQLELLDDTSFLSKLHDCHHRRVATSVFWMSLRQDWLLQ